MALFLTVSSGERAGVSRPILAISDQAVVAEMLRPLGRLFEASAPTNLEDKPADGSTLLLVKPSRIATEVYP